MTVVRYEDAFQDLMADDPKERWTDDSGSIHPFLVEITEAYDFAGVSSEERIQWRKEVKEQWVSYNFNGLPINEVRHNYASVMVDSRRLNGSDFKQTLQSWPHLKTMLGTVRTAKEKFVTWHLEQCSASYELWKSEQREKNPSSNG